MGAIFGKRASSPKVVKNSKITENDRVVLKLKQQRDKIKQYQKRINLQLERERDIVRKLVQDNKKERALLLLKKKKFMESLLERSDNQLLSIEQLVQTIEYQEMQIDIVDKLKIGNEALKKLNEALDIDQIEDILQETKEGAEKQREISNLFAGQAGDEVEENDEVLLKELDELVNKDKFATIDEQMPNINKEPIEVGVEPEETEQATESKVKKNKRVLVEAT